MAAVLLELALTCGVVAVGLAGSAGRRLRGAWPLRAAPAQDSFQHSRQGYQTNRHHQDQDYYLRPHNFCQCLLLNRCNPRPAFRLGPWVAMIMFRLFAYTKTNWLYYGPTGTKLFGLVVFSGVGCGVPGSRVGAPLLTGLVFFVVSPGGS